MDLSQKVGKHLKEEKAKCRLNEVNDKNQSFHFVESITPSSQKKLSKRVCYQNKNDEIVDMERMTAVEMTIPVPHDGLTLSPDSLRMNESLSSRKSTASNLIHVIDKDLRRAFQGSTKSVARIHWFANRKSQILGFCLFLALLGITLALYTFRWIGILAGSSLTIICAASVMWTYRQKKHWHQHPNPIVFQRSVLDFFLGLSLLCNVFVDYQSDQIAKHCKSLAGFTEFFFFTSEAWALMMALDLYSSMNSPFTNYKRSVKFYHFWVWSLGIIMAGITWGIDGAAGFYRVDGQPIASGESNDFVVGFCFASSRICCREDDKSCKGDACTSTNFIDAQTWPWVLVYSFVLMVLLVSVSVLVVAWRRLYSRGVPKTYNIRLRVLNYISFFTGAYVFYWLLLLLFYMSAYFMSRKALDGSEIYAAMASVLRQLVVFIIASKGYLDYVIWFAVNSIDSAKNRLANRSANVDIDLSPQVNFALRSEILYYTTSGIKQSVYQLNRLPPGQGQQEIYLMSGSEHTDKSVKFSTYCPHAFRCIRNFFGVDGDEYTNMFSATTKERFSEGRSGAFMFFTSDQKLIVKTMSFEECQLLQKMAVDYANYLIAHPQSLLTRFYGCHSVCLYGKTYYFVVMGNLFANTESVHYRYDIKGSWVNRNASLPRVGDQVICRHCNALYSYDSTTPQECEDGINFHEPNIVLKDNDMLLKIRMDPCEADLLYAQLKKDSSFLCHQGVMDYSLLMGVQTCEYLVVPSNQTNQINPKRATSRQEITDRTPENDRFFFRTKTATSVNGPARYHFGIIDFLQSWNVEKRLESFYKSSILRKDPNGISAIPPKPYMLRFQHKMAKILAVHDTSDLNSKELEESDYNINQPGLIDVVDTGDVFVHQRMIENVNQANIARPLFNA